MPSRSPRWATRASWRAPNCWSTSARKTTTTCSTSRVRRRDRAARRGRHAALPVHFHLYRYFYFLKIRLFASPEKAILLCDWWMRPHCPPPVNLHGAPASRPIRGGARWRARPRPRSPAEQRSRSLRNTRLEKGPLQSDLRGCVTTYLNELVAHNASALPVAETSSSPRTTSRKSSAKACGKRFPSFAPSARTFSTSSRTLRHWGGCWRRAAPPPEPSGLTRCGQVTEYGH